MEIITAAVCGLVNFALLVLAVVVAGIVAISWSVIVSGVARAISDDYRKRRKGRG